MKIQEIKEQQPGQPVTGFFLIKNLGCKVTNNNTKYLDLTLSDQTGEINAKLWDCSEEDQGVFSEHMIIKVKGSISLWQGRAQLKIEKIRPAVDADQLDIRDFVPAAPKEPEKMYETLLETIDRIKNNEIRIVVKKIVEETREKLLFYPAAQQNHHSVRGGLLFHIITMLKTGEKLSEVYPLINRDLLFGGIILHDIAKTDEMDAASIGIVTDYTKEGQLLGHIIQGIKKIDRVAGDAGVSKEVSLLLQHMVLSHHYEPEFGSPKRPMIPEAELLHYIDMIDARMYDMGKTLENVPAGGFSDRVWVLHNRKLYKKEIDSDSQDEF